MCKQNMNFEVRMRCTVRQNGRIRSESNQKQLFYCLNFESAYLLRFCLRETVNEIDFNFENADLAEICTIDEKAVKYANAYVLCICI